MSSGSHDDNTSHLVEEQIDRQRRQLAGGNGGHTRTDNGGWIPRGVQDALVVASILGLAAAVWNYKESIAMLRTSLEFHQRQIDRLESRQDVLEGRITRGEVFGDAREAGRGDSNGNN